MDNAAKLYPAVATRHWSSAFHLSVQLKESIDPSLLQTAVEKILPRFPSIAVRLRRDFFWYFFEENNAPFIVHKNPGICCYRFRWRENNGYLLRVFYEENAITVEFFHALTDGSGALVFTKTLVAAYLRLRGKTIPFSDGVLNPDESALAVELEDTFLRMPLPKDGLPRSSARAFRFSGALLPPPTLNITTMVMTTSTILDKARSYGITITEYLASVMLYAAYLSQEKEKPQKPLPVRISIPVNMRQYFDSETVRNFSMYVNPGIEPCHGEQYTFERIIKELHAFLETALTPEYLFAGIATNVASEKHPLVQYVPLPIKNLAIRGVFRATGDRIVTTTLTNLGKIAMPDAMREEIERFDFVLGPPAPGPGSNAALISTGEQMCLAFTSNLREDELAEETIRLLMSQGIPVKKMRI